jgi:hypothetical protein
MSSQVADPAINVAMKDLDPMSVPLPKVEGLEIIKGGRIDFDQLAQQKIVLAIFLLNTQHDECINSLEHLSYLHSEYDQHKDFEMLAIFKEPRQAVDEFLQKYSDLIPFRVAIDTRRDDFFSDKLLQAVGISFGHPVALVVDKDVKIKWAGKPLKPGLEVELKELLGPPEHRHPSGPPSTWSDEVLKHLSVPDLKKILFDQDVRDLHGVLEKQELIDKIHSLPPKAA